jgi:glycerol-3-phosphate dehydrogenase (NAD(P)+)
MIRFAVLGSGGWGTALALHLAQRSEHEVRLWSARESTAQELLASRENKRQLPSVPIPESITITADPAEATDRADCWVIGVPTAFLRETLARLVPFARPDVPVISLTKGIEFTTFQTPTQVIQDVLAMPLVASLSGPSHAEEVARGMPTSIVAASQDGALAKWIQEHFGNERLRIYSNGDLIGVELAGALKNVMGLAAGICDGLNFGDNAKAAIVTRGLAEMTRFGVAHGAEPGTFMGLAGMGDLITTCYSRHGRNRQAGERIALGATLQELLHGPKVVEGIYTVRSVQERIRGSGMEMPLTTAAYQVLYESRPISEVINSLLARQQRGEAIPLR